MLLPNYFSFKKYSYFLENTLFMLIGNEFFNILNALINLFKFLSFIF